MSAFASLLLATTIAFPRQGMRLPAIDRCYMIGAVPPGTTNVVVQGRNVAVHPLGGWVTMVDLVEGTNTVSAGETNVTVIVAKKPRPVPGGKPVPEKKWTKLPYAGDVAQDPPTNRAPSAITVVLDPGHGGSETGAYAPHGLPEKDANLRLALAVRTELAARGYRVVMTRETDADVPIYDRPKVAHREKAAAFISVHHNAPPFDRDPRLCRYTSVYAWNAIGDGLAAAISRRMGAELAKDGLKDNGVMHANFAVTRNPEIPSCLIEVDFISTPEGELASWDPARRLRVARAVADGFADWCAGRVPGKTSEGNKE